MVWYCRVSLVHLTRPNATKILVGADGHGSEAQTNGELLHTSYLLHLFLPYFFCSLSFLPLSLFLAYTGPGSEAQTNGDCPSFLSKDDLFKLFLSCQKHRKTVISHDLNQVDRRQQRQHKLRCSVALSLPNQCAPPN